MKQRLTDKQSEFYQYLVDFVVRNHRQPTYREMMEVMRWTSLNSPKMFLDALALKGWIDISKNEKSFRTWKFANLSLSLDER